MIPISKNYKSPQMKPESLLFWRESISVVQASRSVVDVVLLSPQYLIEWLVFSSFFLFFWSLRTQKA